VDIAEATAATEAEVEEVVAVVAEEVVVAAVEADLHSTEASTIPTTASRAMMVQTRSTRIETHQCHAFRKVRCNTDWRNRSFRKYRQLALLLRAVLYRNFRSVVCYPQ
jgi:hypothetical protein